MRIPLIAGNWKMYKTPDEAEDFVKRFRELYKGTDVRALLCVPYTDISAVRKAAEGTEIMIGAQNVFYEKEGAYTGEISAEMLKAAGCDYCIAGHSERRGYFAESDEDVNKKVRALLKAGIKPIICVGESEEIRLSGGEKEHIKGQIEGAFMDITPDDAIKCVIAYEPIWAIGTGRVASPGQAGDMCAFIRRTLIEIFGEETADEIIIQYGGSVKPENISEIMDMPEIDGALVGGASLEPDSFMSIIDF